MMSPHSSPSLSPTRSSTRFWKTLFLTLSLSSLLTGKILAETSALGTQIVTAARQQLGVTTSYDPSYVGLDYPGGDVPLHTGVCTDVIIRALRHLGLDLQKEVHEDMRKNFSAYPQHWGLKRPDKNIDHRRVPNLMRYFERHHLVIKEDYAKRESYLPGDIVTWDLGTGQSHIGIVTDKSVKGTPLIIHNINRGAREEDLLYRFQIIGHYRLKPEALPSSPSHHGKN